MKMRNTYGPMASWIGEKESPTRKFADQLTATAILVAIGLPDCANSSETKNQGIEPGPIQQISQFKNIVSNKCINGF